MDGHYLEGFWRAHQIPLPDVATNPAQLQLLETWMRSYKPEELFDDNGTLLPELKDDGSQGPAPHERKPDSEWRPVA